MELSERDHVWNRAALEAGGAIPPEGDRALAALLAVHGMVMNGGIDHAVEALTAGEFAAGIAGFRYFDLLEVASVLEAAIVADVSWELLNSKYGALVPEDGTLVRAFARKYLASPAAFAPLGRVNA